MTDAGTRKARPARLKLSRIPVACREQARAAFRERDVLRFFISASNEESMSLLWENGLAFREAGLYELALLEAYGASRTNNARESLDDLEALFWLADREKLRAAGDRMPEGELFTLYRGVAGKEPMRKEAGLSWTRLPGKAAWFAARAASWGLADPAVLRTEARAADVLAYINGGAAGRPGEDEFIYLATKWERVEPMPEPA